MAVANKEQEGETLEGLPVRQVSMLSSFRICASKFSKDIIKDMDHPRLNMKVTFPTAYGRRQVKVRGARAHFSRPACP